MACIVMDSCLASLPSIAAACWMFLLTSRCGQGFFPVARPLDPDMVPCIDGDDGASRAEAGWRVCLCSACLTGPNGVIRLSPFLLALVEIRGRFCPWAFLAWHAGPRVVRELICFSFVVFPRVPLLVPAFSLFSDLFPCSRGHTRNCLMFSFTFPFLVVAAICEVELRHLVDDCLFNSVDFFCILVPWSVDTSLAVAGVVPMSFNY